MVWEACLVYSDLSMYHVIGILQGHGLLACSHDTSTVVAVTHLQSEMLFTLKQRWQLAFGACLEGAGPLPGMILESWVCCGVWPASLVLHY